MKKWFEDFDCDKTGTHSYDTIYEPHLDQYKSTFNFLEIGICKGASSRAFLNCYDNLIYYGIDTFKRHKLNIVSDLMLNDRFKILVADSTSNYVRDTIKGEWGDIEFDVMLDDGSHFHNDITQTFQNMYPLLRSGGTYFIEDLFPLTFDGVVFDNPQSKGQRDFFLNNIKHFNEKTFGKLIDTVYSFNPTNVEHIDLRAQDNRIDSYILKIIK